MSDTPSGAPAEVPKPDNFLQATEHQNFAARISDFWWVDVPLKVLPYSKVLWAAWSDGIYLTAWPRIAAVLVVATLAFGFIEGGTHWTLVGLNGSGLVSPFHAVSFAEMFPLLLLAVFLGSLSANLGLMLVIGFGLGDFFWFGAPYYPWMIRHLLLPRSFYFRSSQLAAYLVFFFLTVWPLVATKFLVASAHRRFRESELWKTIMMVVVQALFVYEWTYLAPMGVKWQWSCCDSISQLDVRYFHATTAPWLIVVAGLGIVLRRKLILLAEKRDAKVVSRLYTVCDQSRAANVRIPSWANAVIAAAIMALALLGYAGSLARDAIIFAIIVAVLLCRIYLLPRLSQWDAWCTRVAAYPAVMRLAVATAATYVISRLILTVPSLAASRRYTPQDFGPELAAIVIGFIVLLVLLPKGALSTEEAGLMSDAVPSRLPVPSPAIQAITIIGLILLSSKTALAAACEGPGCCLSGDNGLAGSSVAGTMPSASSAAASGEPQGPPAPGQQIGKRWSDKGGAPLHTGPSSASPTTGRLPGGVSFLYRGTAQDGRGNSWYHVVDSGGRGTGWVNGADTTSPPPPPPGEPHVNLPVGAKTATVLTVGARG